MLDWAKARGIGFSHLVSLGERADVDFGDLLDYLASDAHTRSILLYIESIESPRKFMSAARAAARNKPVIVVKAGRAGNGVKAAASHTGALAGSDIVFDAAIRRAGMLRVDTLQDLFMAAETLARFGGNRDDALTIMTNGGGAGVMAADAAARAGVALARAGRRDAARGSTRCCRRPGRAPTRSTSSATRRSSATSTRCRPLLADPTAARVLFMHAPTAIVRSDDIARACAPIVRSARRPRDGAAGWATARSPRRARVFDDAGVADYETPEEAVRAFAHARHLPAQPGAAARGAGGERERAAATSPRRARSIDARARRGPRDGSAKHEAKALLQAYGIPVVAHASPWRRRADAAAAAARAIGFPVALKILSPRHQPQVRRRRRARSTCATTARVRDAAARDAARACAARGRRRASTASRCSRWCAGRRRRS